MVKNMQAEQKTEVYDAGEKRIIQISVPDFSHRHRDCMLLLNNICGILDASEKKVFLIVDTRHSYLCFEAKNEFIYAMKHRKEIVKKVVFIDNEIFAMIFNALTGIATEYFDPAEYVLKEINERNETQMQGVVSM